MDERGVLVSQDSAASCWLEENIVVLPPGKGHIKVHFFTQAFHQTSWYDTTL